MGVVRREGKWALEKEDEGLYYITHRGQEDAKIITDDYEPDAMGIGNMDVMLKTFEVRTFSDAEREFQNYVERQESGSGLF